jgi:hypothetical protein
MRVSGKEHKINKAKKALVRSLWVFMKCIPHSSVIFTIQNKKQRICQRKIAARLLKIVFCRNVRHRQTEIQDEAIRYIFPTLLEEDSGNINNKTEMKKNELLLKHNAGKQVMSEEDLKQEHKKKTQQQRRELVE